MTILRNWRSNVQPSASIQITSLRKRCVKTTKAMYSPVWDAVRSSLHGRMRTEIINGKDVSTRVLYPWTFHRLVFWQRAMKKSSGACSTSVWICATKLWCADIMHCLVLPRMSVRYTGSTVRLPVWKKVKRLIHYWRMDTLQSPLVISACTR